jgi:hypothetical protein
VADAIALDAESENVSKLNQRMEKDANNRTYISILRSLMIIWVHAVIVNALTVIGIRMVVVVIEGGASIVAVRATHRG